MKPVRLTTWFGTRDTSCFLWGVKRSWLCAFSFWLPQQAPAPASPPAARYPRTLQPKQPQRQADNTVQREKSHPFYTSRSPHSSNIGSSRQQSSQGWRETSYLLLRISVVMCNFWRRFFAVTWSAFPQKIMPLRTEELSPLHSLPGPVRGMLNPAASTP